MRLMLYILVIIFCSPWVMGDSLTKAFPNKAGGAGKIKAFAFDLDRVTLLESPFKTAMENNAAYLLALDPDRFLAWFRKEAGLKPKAKVYGGWENNTIAGHSLGHYLSACSMMCAATGKETFQNRVTYIVEELNACQEAHGSGYLSAFPGGKRAFAEVAQGDIRSKGFDLNGIWVPWYTQHKIMAGLRDAHVYAKSQKALEVWIRHASWIQSILKNLTNTQWQTMLDCEHGGINEVFADLYCITGDHSYFETACRFYHKKVLDPLSQGKDSLSGLHANTQVPKILGAARIFELTGDPCFQKITDFFWNTVINHYTFANGGNSAEEYFGLPDRLAEKMHHTTETCNTYNMLKVTRHLFAWRPKAEYMDYYERALLNHILAHQHPKEGGRLVYKGFMDMPSQKGFSHPTESFWCCVGTGMENHTKYGESIYAYSDDRLYVNLFIPSVLDWKERGIKLTQKFEQDDVILLFECATPQELCLKIRIPYWVEDVGLNGKKSPDGYMDLKRTFKQGDALRITLPKKLHLSRLPDRPNRIAFFKGPVLLAAVLGELEQPPLLVSDSEASLFHGVASNEKIARVLGRKGWMSSNVILKPLYEIEDEPYSAYMDFLTPKQWEQKQKEFEQKQKRLEALNKRTTDFLILGQMQPERDHNLKGEGTQAGVFRGKNWRHAYNGWFEFDMKADPEAAMDLVCLYWGSDRGKRVFDVLVEGKTIATQKLDRNRPNEFFEEIYPIPRELTLGKEKLRVRFQSRKDSYAGGLFACRAIKREP